MTTLPFPLSEEPDDFARERGRLLFADSLGLAPDGSRVVRPTQTIQPLVPDRPENTFQRTNPGVY